MTFHCFLTAAIVLSWGDAQGFEVEAREGSSTVPMVSVTREGESVVDTLVRVIPRGIIATGNHAPLLVFIM